MLWHVWRKTHRPPAYRKDFIICMVVRWVLVVHVWLNNPHKPWRSKIYFRWCLSLPLPLTLSISVMDKWSIWEHLCCVCGRRIWRQIFQRSDRRVGQTLYICNHHWDNCAHFWPTLMRSTNYWLTDRPTDRSKRSKWSAWHLPHLSVLLFLFFNFCRLYNYRHSANTSIYLCNWFVYYLWNFPFS